MSASPRRARRRRGGDRGTPRRPRPASDARKRRGRAARLAQQLGGRWWWPCRNMTDSTPSNGAARGKPCGERRSVRRGDRTHVSRGIHATLTHALSAGCARRRGRSRRGADEPPRRIARIVRVPEMRTAFTPRDAAHRAALGLGTRTTGTLRDTLGLLVTSITKDSPAETRRTRGGQSHRRDQRREPARQCGRHRGLRELADALHASPDARAGQGEAGRRGGAARVSRRPDAERSR